MRESVCVCEHEGIKEESECTYFLLPVLTYASAFAFLAPVLMLPVRTGLSVFGFLILKYSHSILVVCVGSIFFMKPCTVYPGRNFERKGGYDEWFCRLSAAAAGILKMSTFHINRKKK